MLSSSSCVYVFCQDCVLLREREYIYIYDQKNAVRVNLPHIYIPCLGDIPDNRCVCVCLSVLSSLLVLTTHAYTHTHTAETAEAEVEEEAEAPVPVMEEPAMEETPAPEPLAPVVNKLREFEEQRRSELAQQQQEVRSLCLSMFMCVTALQKCALLDTLVSHRERMRQIKRSGNLT